MNEKYILSISIIIAGLLIGTGLFFVNLNNDKKVETEKKNRIVKITEIDQTKDHFYNDKKNAEIFIITYSDLECPGCKAFNKLEKSLIKKYEKNKEVSFVFRHFPLYKPLHGQEALHPTSGIEARASECAMNLGGKDKFFEMIDKIFETTKSDGHYKVENLPNLADKIGIDKNNFNKCMDSDKMKNKIENLWQEAFDGGVKSTPEIYVYIKPTGEIIKTKPSISIINRIIEIYLTN